MEILILIGIFAFVVAIIFRSNEALDRVGEVEKEVKAMEEEILHKKPVQEGSGIVPAEHVTVIQERPVTIAASGGVVPQQHDEPSVENISTFASETVMPRPVEQSTPELDSQPVMEPEQDGGSVQPAESNLFPSGDNVRMS